MTNTERVALLPCPFCGSDKIDFKAREGQYRGSPSFQGHAECWDCGATGPSTCWYVGGTAGGAADKAREMANDWNTRTIPNVDELVEEWSLSFHGSPPSCFLKSGLASFPDSRRDLGYWEFPDLATRAFVGAALKLAVDAHNAAIAAMREAEPVTESEVEAGLEAILAKSDDEIMDEELFQLFGKRKRFTRDDVLRAMAYSFEQGKNHILMLREAEKQAIPDDVEGALRGFLAAYDEWQETEADTNAEVHACAKMLRASDKARNALSPRKQTT